MTARIYHARVDVNLAPQVDEVQLPVYVSICALVLVIYDICRYASPRHSLLAHMPNYLGFSARVGQFIHFQPGGISIERCEVMNGHEDFQSTTLRNALIKN